MEGESDHVNCTVCGLTSHTKCRFGRAKLSRCLSQNFTKCKIGNILYECILLETHAFKYKIRLSLTCIKEMNLAFRSRGFLIHLKLEERVL